MAKSNRLGAALFLMCLWVALGQGQVDLTFGKIYGSAGFLSSESSGTMTDAPATVLSFAAANQHRTLVMTDKAGDYMALLQPGHYCISAYTQTGKPVQLAKNQLRCVDVANGKDVRLDVMLKR